MKARTIGETAMALYPFFAGWGMALDYLHRNWVGLGILAAVSVWLVVVTVRLNLARIDLAQQGIEMRRMLEESRTKILELLVDNVRQFGVIAGLLGGKIWVEEVRRGYSSRVRQTR